VGGGDDRQTQGSGEREGGMGEVGRRDELGRKGRLGWRAERRREAVLAGLKGEGIGLGRVLVFLFFKPSFLNLFKLFKFFSNTFQT
jgi:hypothetical protein